jgi:hypothetical protein
VSAFAGAPAAAPSAPGGRGAGARSGPPGAVLSERVNLAGGRVGATVRLARPAVVSLSASYDPGWQTTVDGRVRATEMLAPAIVGVAVGPGEHRILFEYRGFAYYPELIGLGVASLVALFAVTGRRRRGRDAAVAAGGSGGAGPTVPSH